MASLHIACPLFRSPEIWATHQNHGRPKLISSKKTQLLVCCVKNCTGTLQKIEEKKPEIQLEFIGPKAGADGSFPVDKGSAVSGEKLLRNIMVDNKIELYAAYGKVMNCGGGGSCGTCIVEIVDGKELLNERTNTELRYLKKKPESWRLACQTIVGNKENSGKAWAPHLAKHHKWLKNKVCTPIVRPKLSFNGCRSGRSNHHPRQTLSDYYKQMKKY